MKKIALLSMLVLTLVSFTGCMAPKSANALTVSEEKAWPTTMPDTIPKFKEDSILKVTNIPNSILIKYEGITKEEYTNYSVEIENNGWIADFETNEVAKSYKKGNERVDISLLEDGTMLLDYSSVSKVAE